MPEDSRLALLHAKKVPGDSPSGEEVDSLVGFLWLDSLCWIPWKQNPGKDS